MKEIKLICQNCRTPFKRKLCEHKRNQKNKYSIACSLHCGAILRNKKYSKGNLNNLKSDNRKDEFSTFRYYINKAKSKERILNYGKTNLTLEYLKCLWEKQKGICPYTGYLMELPKTTQDYDIKAKPFKASLDRIDSNKGYIQDNVEFVCLAVNYAKNGFSRDEMMKFFKELNVNHST